MEQVSMKLSELFQRDNVSFPDWLPDDSIPDEWKNAKYFKGNDSHKWELTILSEYNSISFDSKTYLFKGYDENNQLIFEREVTEEYAVIS